MPIRSKDIPLVLALMEDPLAIESTITEKVNTHLNTNMAISTINRRIKKLEESKIIIGSYTQLNHEVIGLKLHTFILIANRKPNWAENMDLLEKACRLHPYTAYKNRIYGSTNGLFTQFRLPNSTNAINLLIKLFEILKEKQILLTYKYIPIEDPVKSYNIGLQYWDTETNTVIFNKDKFIETLTEDHSEFFREMNKEKNKTIPVPKLNIADIVIIREMTRNSRRSQVKIKKDIFGPENGTPYENNIFKDYLNIINKIPNSKQSISRKINNLYDKNVFKIARLYYDRKEFGIFNQLLFIGKHNEKSLGNLLYALENNFLPFDSTIYFKDDIFLFWINMPPVDILLISDILNNYFDDLKIYLLGRKPSTYYLWHENFDINTSQWKTDKEWIVDSVLSNLFDK